MKKLGELTTDEVRALVATPPTCVLLPVGSVEPHGPHLPLATDSIISEIACARAMDKLAARGVTAVMAPSVAYGVTDFAAGFAGAIGLTAATLQAILREIVGALLGAGFSHVCLVNNHLEPAHDAAVRASVASFPAGTTSVACPLTRRWGRTLSDEFKRGNCHAGRYETSLALAAGVLVRPEFSALGSVEVSLSDGIKAGKTTFKAMGMDRAYTGAPAEASAGEGDGLYDKLADMIAAEVGEALAAK